MRSSAVLLACVLASCTNGGDRSGVPRPPPSNLPPRSSEVSSVATDGRTSAPAATASARPAQATRGPAPCPEALSVRSTAPPDHVLGRATAACVDGRRFEGAAFAALRAALGRELSTGSRPKCQAGYPVVTLIGDDGQHTELDFCAQLGAARGYLGEWVLEVRDPGAVDEWLRSAGADVAPRDYAR